MLHHVYGCSVYHLQVDCFFYWLCHIMIIHCLVPLYPVVLAISYIPIKHNNSPLLTTIDHDFPMCLFFPMFVPCFFPDAFLCYPHGLMHFLVGKRLASGRSSCWRSPCSNSTSQKPAHRRLAGVNGLMMGLIMVNCG